MNENKWSEINFSFFCQEDFSVFFQDPFTSWVLAEPHTGHGRSPVWGERNTFSRKGYIPKHQPLPIKISCVLLWSLHADQVVAVLEWGSSQ